ncbi:MAG: galactokinase [Myxococcota bacterium]
MGEQGHPTRGERGHGVESLLDAFCARFGRRPDHAVRAPGRVNLIGEHTDYNDGLVLPCAIDRDTVALAAARDDGVVQVVSAEEGAARFRLDALEARGEWVDYVKAPAWALAARGFALPGIDLAIGSAVPQGAGLSSSAALGVAVAAVWLGAAGVALPKRALAEAVHEGENRFVGVGCGILDPFASALGRRDHALRIDCRDRSVEPVALPPLALLVAHSGVTRTLSGVGYKDRVAECAAALTAARRAGLVSAEARSLRALGVGDLPALERALDPTGLRRVRHVVTENERVDAFRAAVRAADLPRAGAVLRAGMRSLRDDYAVSVPELDRLCALGDAAAGCHGSRLTGAGFGGCTLHLVEPAAAAEVAGRIATGFERAFGRVPRIWRVHPADGVAALAL